MTLKPNSLNPADIAAICPALSDKRGVEALVVVHAAIEEIQATADRLVGSLPERQQSLDAGDEIGLIAHITELRDMFEHLGGHCEEASGALWEITDSLAGLDKKDSGSL